MDEETTMPAAEAEEGAVEATDTTETEEAAA